MVSRETKWNAARPVVPVDSKGNWLSFPRYQHTGWEEVRPFYAELVVDSMRTGRSSKIVILLARETGKTYPMFVADLVKGIQHGHFTVAGGVLRGWWTASKRGANYGIRAIPVEDI